MSEDIFGKQDRNNYYDMEKDLNNVALLELRVKELCLRES